MKSRWACLAAVTLLATLMSVPAYADPPEVAVSVSPSTASPGDTVTVTETVTNNNGFAILQPYVRALSTPGVLPVYTTLEGCTGAIGPCTTLDEGNGPIGYQAPINSLPGNGSSATVTFTLKLAANAPGGPQTLQGQLTGSNYGTPPINGPTLTVLSQADVSVALTATPHLGSLDFRVTIKNHGPAPLQTATVTTPMPPGLTATSTTCTPAVTCTFTGLPNGATANATFRVPLTLLTIGPYTFTAHRTTSTPQDPTPTNDTDTVHCNVVTPLIVNCA